MHILLSASQILPDSEHRGLTHFLVVALNLNPCLQISHSAAFLTEHNRQLSAVHCTHEELETTLNAEHAQSRVEEVQTSVEL